MNSVKLKQEARGSSFTECSRLHTKRDETVRVVHKVNK